MNGPDKESHQQNILKMSSLISGIIDCVARPSTSDSPVRILGKSTSQVDSPTSVSDTINTTDSEITFNSLLAGAPSSSSRAFIPGEATAVFPVSTAEAVNMITNENDMESDRGDYCDDGTMSSSFIDNAIRQQFEAAFATFLYKNPAFTSMSHANLTRLRSKLFKESARNARAEAELRRQLEELTESKRRNELDLQRELLVVTRAKAVREAELCNQIWKAREASMSLDESMRKMEGFRNEKNNSSSLSMQLMKEHEQLYNEQISSPRCSFVTATGRTFENIVESSSDAEKLTISEELMRSRVEYAHLCAEIEKLKEMIEKGSSK